MEHPLGGPRLVRPGLVGALSAAVVEDLLDGLDHVLPAALQDQLQDAALVAGEDAGQDVDGVHVAGDRGGRGRLLLVFVGLRARIGADGADGAWSFSSVFQRLRDGRVDERLAVSVLRAGASVPAVRGGHGRGRVALGGCGFAGSLLGCAGPGQLALRKRLELLDA